MLKNNGTICKIHIEQTLPLSIRQRRDLCPFEGRHFEVYNGQQRRQAEMDVGPHFHITI